MVRALRGFGSFFVHLGGPPSRQKLAPWQPPLGMGLWPGAVFVASVFVHAYMYVCGEDDLSGDSSAGGFEGRHIQAWTNWVWAVGSVCLYKVA